MEEKRIIQIEAYLTGQMNETDKAAFEKKLLTDKNLAMEVEQYKDMLGGLRLRNNSVLKDRLNEIHDQVVNQPQTPKVLPIRRRLVFAVAAAACLLLLVSIFLFRNDGINPENLYASNYEPYQVDWDTRGTDNEALVENIKNLYVAKNYEDLALLLAIDSIQSQISDVKFTMVKGIVALENNDFKTAHENFDIAAGNPVMAQEAQWYKALTYLKQKDIDNSKAILEKFAADESSDYFEEAREILLDLK